MTRYWLPAILVIAGALSFISAAKPTPQPDANPTAQTASSTMQAPADVVLVNGMIYTIDEKRPWASAVAIRGESIVAVADAPASSTEPVDVLKSPDFKHWVGPKTRVIDLHRQFAMPGFNDAHVHLAGAGYGKFAVNFEGAQSLSEFQQRIRERLKDFQPGEWMTGRGWDHTLWPEKGFPTREDLDAVAADRPMLFSRMDGHVAVANSRALKIAGVTGATPDPPGGHIEHDSKTDEPNGMLEEDAAINLVYRHVPAYSLAQRRHALELVIDEASKYGVTSMQDNSVTSYKDDGNFSWQNFMIYQQMRREGKLKARITEWLSFGAPIEQLEEMRRAGSTTDPWVKTGALKAILDGSLGSRTAAMIAPYSDDSSTSGILRLDPAQVKAFAIERDRAGFQLAFHAIGDRANRVALDTFEVVRAANGPRDRRDRIEHAQIVSLPDLPRFGSLDVIASMQPSHLLDDQRWATDRIGSERIKGAYAWRTMEKNGVHLAFGTDFPVESVNPLRGIYSCVTRELPGGGPEGGWHPEEKLTMADCLRDYTVGAAYAQFEETRKGTISPGMLADIVVFPSDITQIPARDLLKLPVVMTIVGGRVVYEASKAQ
jgi:predicted amidohydrolase YtcJ